MPILSCKYDEQDWGIKTDENRGGHYKVKWKITSKGVQTGLGILALVRGVQNSEWDYVPDQGEHYKHLDGEDAGSFAGPTDCHRMSDEEESNNITTWELEVDYAPPRNNSKREKDKLTKPNPLDWSPIYWMEWIEDTEVVEEAFCITDLPHLLRGINVVGSPEEADGLMGPIVNAAGQQTIDPLTEPGFHPVLCCEINYPSALQAIILNATYKRSVNFAGPDEEDPVLFLGDDPRTWRYMQAQAGKPEEKEVKGIGTVTYYPTLIKLEYNPKTWDRFVLNNGQSCFRKWKSGGGVVGYVHDPRFGDSRPMLFPTTVQVLSDPTKWPEDTNAEVGQGQPTVDDFEEIESSEPVNLKIDGTQERDPEAAAIHIQYRHKNELDFNLIPPFIPLVEEYNTLFP